MENNKIFKPDIYVNNNKQTFYSFLDDKVEFKEDDSSLMTPRMFIEFLRKDNDYMFSKSVIIKTLTDTYDTRIAGVIGDRVITFDNIYIPIDDILNISLK